jgi:hypothetical protein
MKKAELVIDSTPDDDLVAGHCSSCSAVQFRLRGNNLRNKELLRTMFDKHFGRVHMRDEASQSAARIVRKATDD